MEDGVKEPQHKISQVSLNYQQNGTSGQLPATAYLLKFRSSIEIIWQQF